MCLKITSTSLDDESLSVSKGFSLVIALILMSLVLLLIVSLSSVIVVESKLSNSLKTQVEAEQAAMLGLKIAIGKLQQATGPDQRVTATGNIRSATAPGNQRWVGVWDTSEIDRLDPTQGRDHAFVEWLVSTSATEDSTDITYANDSIDDDGVSGITLFGGTTPAVEDDVKVPLVGIDANSSYAYWIEDEGVKAKITYRENADRINNMNADLAQAGRLAANSWINFSQLNGLFSQVESFQYPINASGNSDLLSNVNKITSEKQILSIDTSLDQEWLDESRHDFTFYSHGLLTNVRDGGLRRDLTLAFEMDGAKDDPNSLGYFNASHFVGKGSRDKEDLTSAVYKPEGQDFFARNVYVESVDAVDGYVRGPTWHNVRDYYNLYKRLKINNGQYVLESRPYYPNRPDLGSSNKAFISTSNFPLLPNPRKPTVQEIGGSNNYIYRPTRGAYVPVLLGYRSIVSLFGYEYDSTNDQIKIGIAYDPWIYLWNPYDKKISFENYKVTFGNSGIPLEVGFAIREGDKTIETFDAESLSFYLSANDSNNSGSAMFFLGNPDGAEIVMEPGEVMVFSAGNPHPSDPPLRLRAYPGANAVGDERGVMMWTYPEVTRDSKGRPMVSGSREILIDNASDASVDVNFELTSSQHSMVLGTLVDHENMDAAMETTSNDVSENETVMIYMHTGSGDSPDTPSTSLKVSDIFVSDLAATSGGVERLPLAYFDDFAKSTQGDESQQIPVGVFAHFNPFSYHTNNLYWLKTTPSRYVSIVQSSGSLSAALPQHTDGAAYWGNSYHSANGQQNVSVREIPTTPLLSLASLRHGDFAPYPFEPVNAIGNSKSTPFVGKTNIVDLSVGGGREVYVYDASWLFNDALWDGYFFSGIAPDYNYTSGRYAVVGGTDAALEQSLLKFFDNDPTSTHGNSRYLPYLNGDTSEGLAEDLSTSDGQYGYSKIAGHILVDGGFNINSTSSKAWAALLSANRALAIEVAGKDVSAPEEVTPFPRTTAPLSGNEDAWLGYSGLDQEDIENLSDEIVHQIKLRGPFMSLADFVNRRLSADVTGDSGAIQAAIDSVTINSNVNADEGRDFSYAEINSSYSNTMFANESVKDANTADSINGHLTQADILQPIAPILSARSDTFRIRSLGKKVDPVTGDVATAICEAVVQRIPEFVDSSDELSESVQDLNDVNIKLGRRFQMVSFNWLKDV